MKLYSGLSPNGARVSIFMTEKGIDIPVQPVDILGGETRSAEYRRINPLGEVPALELDDGTVLTESVAICRYLETLHPDVPLLGQDALQQARIEMWNRRIELRAFNCIGDVGRHEFELFKPLGQVPEFAAFRRRQFPDVLTWLDEVLADGRAFIAGEAFSIADITAMAMFMIMQFADFPLPAKLKNVQRWADALRARPSFPAMPG